MFFIAIILSIAIELSVKPIESWRHFAWFSQFTDWVCHQMESSPLKDGPVVLIAILAPILFAIWLASAMLGGVWGLFEFLFSVVVLSASLGPADPVRQTQEYIKAMMQDDINEANIHAASLLGREADSNKVVTAQNVKETLIIKTCSSILAVFFWFILLGAVGAAMFRLTCLLKERYDGVQTGLARSIVDLYQILMWIPARLTVFCFAIVGNFVDAMQSLKQISELWQPDSEALLVDAGLGAIHSRDLSEDDKVDIANVEDCLALVKRAVLAWITILAIVVIVSWIF